MIAINGNEVERECPMCGNACESGADDPDLQQTCDERKVEAPLHITLSCVDGAHPKETG